MLRFFKLILLGVLMIGIIVLSVANRGAVEVRLLPEGMSEVFQRSIEVPLYAVSLASILTGLLIGYILEYLREHKHRRMASQKKREAHELQNEVAKLRKRNLSDEEEVLAILDKTA